MTFNTTANNTIYTVCLLIIEVTHFKTDFWVFTTYTCTIIHMTYNSSDRKVTFEKSQKCMGINCTCTIKAEGYEPIK